jgi:hypothetical protein
MGSHLTFLGYHKATYAFWGNIPFIAEILMEKTEVQGERKRVHIPK